MELIRYTRRILSCLLLALGWVAPPSYAEDSSPLHEARAFTLLDGQTTTLKVLDWSEKTRKFHVESKHGQKAWVSPRRFSDADRAYFKEWIAAKWFLSNQKLYVSAKRAERGGYVYYNISIHNKTPVDYAKVSMQYEVERILDNYETGKEENKNVPGKIFIGLIKSGSRRGFKTQPVRASETYVGELSLDPVLVTDGVTYTYTNEVPRKTGKEKVNGIRLKFLGPMLNNVRVVREVRIAH